MKYLPFFLTLFIIVVPSIVSAQPVAPGGLVPCEGADCTMCSVVQLVNEIVKWLIGILMAVFAIITVSAGFGLVTSGGNPQAKTAAKQKLINAFIGLVIVLSAWLLVDTLMRAILAGGTGEIDGMLWSTVSCVGQAPTSAGPAPGPAPGPDPGPSSDEEDAVNRVTARCGDAINTPTATEPSSNLCSPDTDPSVISAVTGGGGVAWQWSCGNRDCFVASTEESGPLAPDANGCGPVDAVVTSKPADADLCLIPGTHVVVGGFPTEPDREFSWVCGLDPAIPCSTIYNPGVYVPLECGPADGVPTFSFPSGTSNLCRGPSGVYADTSGESLGFYRWTCEHAVLQDSVSCSAPLAEGNRCGSGYAQGEGGESTSLPSSGSRCARGNYVPIEENPDIGDKYRWACTEGGGNPVQCESTRLEDWEDIWDIYR